MTRCVQICNASSAGLALAISCVCPSASADIAAGPSHWRDLGLPTCNASFQDYDKATNLPCVSGAMNPGKAYFCYEQRKPWQYDHWSRYYGTYTNCAVADSKGLRNYGSHPPLRCPPGYTYSSPDLCVPDDGPVGDKNGGPPLCASRQGNPIDVTAGSKYQREEDFASNISGLGVTRHYSFNGSLSTTLRDRVLGAGWRHSYDRYIMVTHSPSLSTAFVYRPEGRALYFTEIDGVWTPDGDVHEQLVRLADSEGEHTGWVYSIDGSDEIYDENGRLTMIRDPKGIAQTFVYSDDLLRRIDVNTGETLVFSYDSDDRLSTVTDQAGWTWAYEYDANNNLRSVIFPDATPESSSDNPRRIYYYEEARFRHALTGITDERGIRYATYGYDEQGRAALSTHAGDAGRVEVHYGIDGTRTITDSRQNQRVYVTQENLGRMLVQSASGTCGCGL